MLINKISFNKIIDRFGSWLTMVGYLKNYSLKEGDIVVDAGAYYGYFTIFAAKKVGKKGRVIAFEPNPQNCEILRNNVALARLDNVAVIKRALFNKNIEIDLKSDFSRSSVVENKKAQNGGVKIQCALLDDEIKRLGLGKIDFLKMDIEGAEIEVFEGAKESLKNISQLAVACYHKRGGKTTGQILRPLLTRYGFDTKIGFCLHQTLYGSKRSNYLMT